MCLLAPPKSFSPVLPVFPLIFPFKWWSIYILFLIQVLSCLVLSSPITIFPFINSFVFMFSFRLRHSLVLWRLLLTHPFLSHLPVIYIFCNCFVWFSSFFLTSSRSSCNGTIDSSPSSSFFFIDDFYYFHPLTIFFFNVLCCSCLPLLSPWTQYFHLPPLSLYSLLQSASLCRLSFFKSLHHILIITDHWFSFCTADKWCFLLFILIIPGLSFLSDILSSYIFSSSFQDSIVLLI